MRAKALQMANEYNRIGRPHAGLSFDELMKVEDGQTLVNDIKWQIVMVANAQTLTDGTSFKTLPQGTWSGPYNDNGAATLMEHGTGSKHLCTSFITPEPEADKWCLGCME